MIPAFSRYPGERRALWAAIGVAAAATAIFTPLSAGAILLLVLLGVGMNWARTASAVSRIRRSAAPVERFPELAEAVARCAKRLDIEAPLQVYVAQSDQINAFATGSRAPYTVVLYTGLLEALTPDEVAFVIGHELGHVKCGHTTWLTLIGHLGHQSFGRQGLSVLLQIAFLQWMRGGVFSADRAGLVACGSLEAALSTQLVLAVGRARARQVDLDALVRRWRAEDVGAAQKLGDVFSTHPGVHSRLDALVDFAAEAG